VDRNTANVWQLDFDQRSRLHGRVDRNVEHALDLMQERRRAFTGAWIETAARRHCVYSFDVAPSRARGSKLAARMGVTDGEASRLHGRVDRNAKQARTRSPAARSRLHGRVDRNVKSLPV